MTIQKAPGSTVLRMIRNGLGLLNIEVETDWSPEAIKALADEEGYVYDDRTARFRPAPLGAVVAALTAALEGETPALDAAPETDTGAEANPAPSATASGNEPSIVAPAPVSPPIGPRLVPADDTALAVDPAPQPARVTLDPAPTISAGLAHTDPGIRAIAETARDTIAALATALVEWEQRGEARAEVARLEEELAAARVRAGLASLGGGAPVATSRKPRGLPSGEAQRIRAWAAANGVPCTRTGIVPRHVVEQYQAATEGIAS